MSKDLVWLFITITSIQEANAMGTITIQLVEYNHRDGKDVGGICCENFSKDGCKADCDPYFIVCLKSHITGNCVSSKTTDRTTDVGHIQFGSSIGATQNNIVMNVSGSMSDLDLNIDVLDSDSDGIFDQKDDLIDTLVQRMQLIPTLSSQPPAVFTDLELQGTRTSISLRYRAQCDQYYYGNDCDIICQPQPKQYICDIQGNKICFANWTGPNCDNHTDDCWSNPCLNGGTCKNGNMTYTCTCRLDFTGYQCESSLPTTVTTTPTALTNIPTVQNTTFTKQILSSSMVVSVSINDSITTTISMTTAPMLGSITSKQSPIVTMTTMKATNTGINLPCKVVVDNSSVTDMVRIQNIPSDQLSIFQGSLQQQLQNLTGSQASTISISVTNKTAKNQYGKIDVSFSVTSNNRALNSSVIYAAAVEVCLLTKLQSRSQQKQKYDDSSTGLVVAIVVGSLLGLAALCVLIIGLVKRNKKRQTKVSHSYDVENHVDGAKKLENVLKDKTTNYSDNISRKGGGGICLEMHACMNESIKQDFTIRGNDLPLVQITGTHQIVQVSQKDAEPKDEPDTENIREDCQTESHETHENLELERLHALNIQH